ncbi:MAG: 2-oxoglutarate dehydrogenase complex dihydrolipoyllysine-residue succinyltransferase [Pseudomonadota bacterium]
MSIDIKVPVLPESVADATIATWHKKPGEAVSRDENLVDIETDKVVLEVVAPEDGFIDKFVKEEGDTVLAEEVIALFTPGAAETTQASTDNAASTEPASAAEAAATNDALSPSVRRVVGEHGLNPATLEGTGKGGRITKEDAQKAASGASAPKAQSTTSMPSPVQGAREERREPMTRLRQRIAERLVEAQQTAAMLTTFNEVNMKPLMDIRKRYKDEFEKQKGVRLGFMSFFCKAVVEALKRFPEVNASIDGTDVVYHGYYDVGVAVSSPRGLVVPVLRDVDLMSIADIERGINEYAKKAKDNKLGVEELTGGTFTISNGGVFGSLMSTPIINPPQSGILGMHRIQERPMAVDGQVVILPMMYLAFSYDHRIIDGKESVSFLKTVKELLEDPSRLLLNI